MPPPPRPAPAVDHPALRVAAARAAEPAAARAGFQRLLEADPEVGDLLVEVEPLRHGFAALACASRSLTSAVIRRPGLLRWLGRDGRLDVELDAARLRRPGGPTDPAAPPEGAAPTDPDGLRRFKQAHLLRVAVRDLLGRADLPTVGRELAALAEVCLQFALELAGPDLPMAVIGMGKLGGRELNYASDVDVLFAHEGPQVEAEQVARRLLAIMAEPTEDGIVFRTDAELRPEGRAGALSRSVEGYRTWWERWARPWEFQALIKARPVAGDPDLGRRFCAEAEPFTWPEVLAPDAVREVRTMKARAEAETARRGVADRELKRGPGGIRDVEFAVQLLQMVHGRHDPTVRCPGTLDALGALADAGYVAVGDAARLAEAYRFLRTTEHRLQLWDEQQTHTLPTDAAARTRLARVLGYRDGPERSAVEAFEADHRSYQHLVRGIHQKLFFAPIIDALAGRDGPLRPDAALERLGAFGFTDVEATRAALAELAGGLSRASRLLAQMLPLLLEWCSASPDPDLALLQLRRLTEGPTRTATLAATFRDRPVAAERVCALLGSSRLLGDALRRHPDVVAALGDDDELARPLDRRRVTEEARAAIVWRARDPEARRVGLRRFTRRSRLWIGARDLLGFADLDATGADLVTLAESCLEAALGALDPQVPFAVVGMGRFGGHDLSYASDLDVLFVYEGAGPADFAEAERVATQLIRELSSPGPEGVIFEVDPDLRPEGRGGVLARSLEGYRTWYGRWAWTWEYQALLKARPVAGDRALGARFTEMVEPFVYRPDFGEAEVREVRRMKARIERERIPPGEDPQFHLKLGRGSLSDVEFTTQLLQLRHGHAHPALRTTRTPAAIDAAVAVGVLEADDGAALLDAYRFCSQVRNRLHLLTATSRMSLPTDGVVAERLGRMLGYVHRPRAALRDEYRRVTRRARAVVERVFYGRRDDGTPTAGAGGG
jgi:glutamate-ammonia-ligase adenylyltransferase